MSWQEAAREVGGQARGRDHRLSASTLKRTARGGQMEADGVLAMVRWLGLAFEDFTLNAKPTPAVTVHKHGLRRFSSQAFYEALDGRRQSQNHTWKDIAAQLDGFSPGMLKRLAKRGRMTVEQVVRLSSWLEAAPEEFTRGASR